MARDNNLPAGEHARKHRPAHEDADHPGRPDRRDRDRDPAREHPPAADLRGDHEHRDHHDLHRLPARHGADAARADPPAVAPGGHARGLLHDGTLRASPSTPSRSCWGAGMAINLAWPRSSIYNATEPFHWYLKWGAVLFVGVVMLGGFAYYWFVQRHKTGTLAAHAHVAEEPAAAPPPAIAGGSRVAAPGGRGRGVPAPPPAVRLARRAVPGGGGRRGRGRDACRGRGDPAITRSRRPTTRTSSGAAPSSCVGDGRLLDLIGAGEMFGFASILAEEPLGFVARAVEDDGGLPHRRRGDPAGAGAAGGDALPRPVALGAAADARRPRPAAGGPPSAAWPSWSGRRRCCSRPATPVREAAQRDGARPARRACSSTSAARWGSSPTATCARACSPRGRRRTRRWPT